MIREIICPSNERRMKFMDFYDDNEKYGLYMACMIVAAILTHTKKCGVAGAIIGICTGVYGITSAIKDMKETLT
jgi:hypothetical protein